MKIPSIVADLLRVAAPTLLTAFLGPMGGVAASIATSALDKWMGVEADKGMLPIAPEAVVSTIQKNIDNPNFVLDLRKAEIDLLKYENDLGFKFAELAVKDKASSRDFQVASSTAAPLMKWGMGIVAVSLLSLLAVVFGSLLLIAGFVRIPAETVQMAVGVFGLIGSITGYISSYGTQILSFYYGDSAGSQNKTNALTEALQSSGEQLGQAAATASRVAAAAADKPVSAPQVVVVPSAHAHTKPDGMTMPTGPSRFITLIEKLLDHEGGYSDSPNDPGGCTNWGITIGTLGDWRGVKVTCQDVHDLTRAEAKEIYFAKYWNAVKADMLPPGVDYIVFDFGVNAGVRRSASFLQTILAKRDPSLKVDGAIGPLTIAALAKASPRAVVDEFHDAKMAHYKSLDTWPTFGKGWTNRANETLAEARASLTTTNV